MSQCDKATQFGDPGDARGRTRPAWCEHNDCIFVSVMGGCFCVGMLPEKMPHGGDWNDRRICLKAFDDGDVVDLAVNKTDLNWIRLACDALDGRRSSAFRGDDCEKVRADAMEQYAKQLATRVRSYMRSSIDTVARWKRAAAEEDGDTRITLASAAREAEKVACDALDLLEDSLTDYEALTKGKK